MALPLAGSRDPITLLKTPESDSDARFSPDGRFVAYHSRMNGRSLEVYVQGFDSEGRAGLTGNRLQISNKGGVAPVWRRDGKELFYSTMEGTIMAVDLQLSPSLRAERPRELFRSTMVDGRLHSYAIGRDGKRFMMVLKPRLSPEPPRLTVVTNWRRRLTD
jgi:Tol biopolymer transport system component